MKRRVALLILMGLLLTGCGIGNSNTVDITESKQEIFLDAKQFISGTKANELVNMENIEIDPEDIISNTDSAKCYISYSACYVQIDKYMYRFQLDESGHIVSYIKYTVEG